MVEKKKNLISSLLIDGHETMEFEEIANEATSFFTRLYKKERGEGPIIEYLFKGEISRDQCGYLERPFCEEEVKNAIFSMDGVKAPRPDGLSILFYQVRWESIKEDLMKVFSKFFDRGISSVAMRSTFLVLIPKVEGAKEMGKFCPISLVISKVLTGRLKEVMEEVISATQSAFIQGRQILDNIIIAN